MSRLSAGLLSSASYARREFFPRGSCVVSRGGVRLSPGIPGGNVGMRPKQPPSTLKQARGQSRRCLLRFPLTFLPTYLLFSRRFLRLDSFSATETDMFLSRPLLSFHAGYAVYPSDVFFSLSLSWLSAFPSTITPLSRGDIPWRPLYL